MTTYFETNRKFFEEGVFIRFLKSIRMEYIHLMEYLEDSREGGELENSVNSFVYYFLLSLQEIIGRPNEFYILSFPRHIGQNREYNSLLAMVTREVTHLLEFIKRQRLSINIQLDFNHFLRELNNNIILPWSHSNDTAYLLRLNSLLDVMLVRHTVRLASSGYADYRAFQRAYQEQLQGLTGAEVRQVVGLKQRCLE